MDFDKSYISGVQFLSKSGGLQSVITSVLIFLHSIVAYFLFASVGESYRAVIEELTHEAALNGTVLTMEQIQSTDDKPIPSEFAPSPVFVIAMIVSVALHVLFFLSQKWSVNIRMFMQYKKQDSISSTTTHVCVYPPEFRGKPEILPLTKNKSELVTYNFEFQRRKYEIVNKSQINILSYPLNVEIKKFITDNNGIGSQSEVQARQRMYGMNKVDIPIPPFYQLYIDQLLSPIPIFQLFCSALWMMDEYWKYTMFTLLTIFGFEVSTTFQRKRSLETLKSMSGKVVVQILAKRGGGGASFVQITSDQLVPGDRIRLLPPTTTVVPCDCLIVGGSAVVNEASLTGESIPQMKDSIDDDTEKILDINGVDKIHCLFAGTNLIRQSELELIVLRTGSQSSQGELLRMVEFSQQDVSSDKRDTMYLLLLLLTFAIIAASYVVYERISGAGSENLNRMKTHKLILRVIMIITSVVPPELPLQMSLSVNTALMALHKIGIFCTEPFRVPMAGTVSHCFFDKTGTLTSDQLICHTVTGASQMASMIVAGCHSLIEVDGKIVGDPVEKTALEFVGWKFLASENKVVVVVGGGGGGGGGSDKNNTSSLQWIKILHRFHFSSQLQRMSCVIVTDGGKYFSVIKGSPEVILARCGSPGEMAGYMAEYEKFAHEGKRVLALAYKSLSSGSGIGREEAESNLKFAGFASFGCDVRADTLTVINALTQAAELPCVMVTGDALLTAIHVAKETGIIDPKKEGILRLEKNSERNGYVWKEVMGTHAKRMFAFNGTNVLDLSRKFGLVVSGSDLPHFGEDASGEDGISSTWSSVIPYIAVFARMNPIQKEHIIAFIRSRGGKPLMCGDGGNDVGALKQADVGVALLAGFGDANTGGVVTSSLTEEDAEEKLERDAKIVALKQKKLSQKIKVEFEAKKKELMAKQQEWMNEEIAKPGNAGYWAAIKTVTSRLREELAKEGKNIQAKYAASGWDRKTTTTGSSSLLTGSSASPPDSAAADNGRPTVQMGDASVAAPFTSRAPSIRSVVEIIRQGRCTLLVAVQMMQIMMMESLISAYTFAAITMEGGRSTEIQLIGSSMFVMIASIAFTYAKPNKKLSNVIPLKSVFDPAIFFSVFLQVSIHLSVLVYAMSWAKSEMGPDALSSLYDFERERDEKLTKLMDTTTSQTNNDSEGWFSGMTSGLDMLNMFKSVPYRPNLLNTVMFLVKTSQQVSVLVVNYKGSPWMQGALENKALFLSMFACCFGIVICSSGYIPWINQMLELMVLPGYLRSRLLGLLATSTVGTFVADRLVVYFFAPKIFMASTWRPLMATRIGDFVPILKTCCYILAGVFVLPFVLGNPIGMFGGFYAYRTWKKWKEDKEMAELEVYMHAGGGAE